jgi:hypothetical protein
MIGDTVKNSADGRDIHHSIVMVTRGVKTLVSVTGRLDNWGLRSFPELMWIRNALRNECVLVY